MARQKITLTGSGLPLLCRLDELLRTSAHLESIENDLLRRTRFCQQIADRLGLSIRMKFEAELAAIRRTCQYRAWRFWCL
jgi:hypothetical protein